MLRDGQTEMFIGAGRKSSKPLYRCCEISALAIRAIRTQWLRLLPNERTSGQVRTLPDLRRYGLIARVSRSDYDDR
jgi:hypothetical protein